MTSGMTGLIILVEDNIEVSEVLEHLIEDGSKGLKVISFTSGKEALSYLLNNYNSVSGVISDLMMSEMDGIDFLASLRQDGRTSELPFLFLSGADPSVFSNLLKGYKFSGFISKPVQPAGLKALIQMHFRSVHTPTLAA